MATKYRCDACGNKTRFTVVRTTKERAFHHFTLGGQLAIEDPEVLADEVESVECRWCNHGDKIEVIEES